MAKTPEIFIEVVTTLDEDASDVRDIKTSSGIRQKVFQAIISLLQ